jgi:UDP-N-acetylmuramoylalanine--D-glutamate ligase
MDLQGKRVLVLGMARSGMATARFLAARGAQVLISDSRPASELTEESAQLRRAASIQTEFGGHSDASFRDKDLIVVSPGVPADLPQLMQARARGVAVIGEMELASRFLQGPVIAITGSNGKTTTTALTGEVLARSGKKTLVGGNIGTPAISLVEESVPDGFAVLEASSFQLETVDQFRPFVAVILNITSDHLDRHGNMEAYAAAKARIFENQTETDFAVLNSDDAVCRTLAGKTLGQVCWFSRQEEVKAGACVRAGKIIWRKGSSDREIMPVSEIPLKGAHNLENVLAAVAVGMLCSIEPAQIRAAVREFRAVEHRLEFVANIAGVDYYNDSKATNVDATIKALESFPANIHLILGGKDKGSDYTVLAPLIRERVKRVYTIGAAAEKIERQIISSIHGTAEIVRSGTLAEAVRQASRAAQQGDVVLLAPACASFDQFQNYEHRGRVFKELVQQLQASDCTNNRTNDRAPAQSADKTAKRKGA